MDNDRLAQDIRCLARGFHEIFLPPAAICFLKDLIDEDLRPDTLHVLFALLRTELPKISHKPARYAPIASAGAVRSGFPLHADLFQSKFLVTIFDNVPADASGASLLLSTRQLMQIAAQIDSISKPVLRRIAHMLTTRAGRDRYDELFDVLHGFHPWSLKLRRALPASQIRIKLYRGEGYVLDDRKWLHGREPLSIDVDTSRMHRLAFAVRETVCESDDQVLRRLLKA